MCRLRVWIVALTLSAAAVFGQDSFEGVARIVAVGDVHGDFDQLVTVLRDAGVIDKRNKWSGGKTTLVQTGDVLDRGATSRKAMDLLMDLEKQARKTGGQVLALIGNHEAMNVYGDLRYVSAGEYAAFKTQDSQQVREQYFQGQLETLRKDAAAKGLPATDDALRSRFEAETPLGWVEQRMAFSAKGKYGEWIRQHNAVVKVNDMIFLHGGLGPKYGSLPLTQINDRIRLELTDFMKLEGGMTMDADGPLWFRGYARDPEASLRDALDGVLKAQGATTMVMGHTVTAGAVMERFDGKVILIDVGLSKVYGGPPACLVVEGGKRIAMHRGQRLELPKDNAGMLAYLKAAAALDPQPSPLGKLIEHGAAASVVSDEK
jgi:hypothetical protein